MGDQKKAADKLYDIRRTILVVDDEEVNRELLKKYLRDDYELLFACNGLEAPIFDSSKAEKPHISWLSPLL